MSGDEELTYYEYWLTKETWNGSLAIDLIVDYIMLQKSWSEHEIFASLRHVLYEEIRMRMFNDNSDNLFRVRAVIFDSEQARRSNLWIEQEIDAYASEVWPDRFLEWLHKRGYRLPYEFKVFIGVEERVEIPNKKLQEQIDREVIQGIARTLWDEYPEMTIEQMYEHKAIRLYGSGHVCCADTTLKRWLGEVDPRAKKRGRKKKAC
ncbi:hypothetical protein [Geoanaerobacter pelophilus]|uniref:hypothetical protein n=1 Tax=Geoanaerobacter pelophilus TaxID=60036 RepID=UPI000A26D576|nr:hypothetical protein [Geoanaerobacter pelophilus]